MVGLYLLLPFTATAQQQIEKTFDALRQSKAQKEVWSERAIEKDPETGKLKGLSDIYDFLIMNPQNKNLVTAIEQAFRQDEGKAYSVKTGNRGGEEHYTTLAVGNSNTGGVAIGLMKAQNTPMPYSLTLRTLLVSIVMHTRWNGWTMVTKSGDVSLRLTPPRRSIAEA